MKEANINYIKTDAFLILGVMGPKIVIDKEGAAILALAWRCLYAETVGARAEDREPDLETALKRMVAMLIGRVTAYGEKWRRWFVKQQHQSDPKVIPERHRRYKFIDTEYDGTYIIRGILSKSIFFDKDKMNEIKFSEDTTQMSYSKNSFIYDFLYSLREKINDPLGKRKIK